MRSSDEADEADEYVGPHDVARVLRMSPKTVIRWADNGWLSDAIPLHGDRRRKDVEALAEQMKRKRPKDGRD